MTRAVDIVLASALLIFFLPLLTLLAVIVKLQDGGPIFYGHTRIGLGGRSFKCLKFRTMVVDSERRLSELLSQDPEARAEWERDFKLRHDPRITFMGRFMRKMSLDELPQFFNVFRGDMALVGPRPVVQAELQMYGRRVAQYMSVRPGITGLWQVSGRSTTSYRRRVAMDTLYVRKKNLAFDLKLMILTVPAIILEKGAY